MRMVVGLQFVNDPGQHCLSATSRTKERTNQPLLLLLRTPPNSSELLRTPPNSSELLRTPPNSSDLLRTPPNSSELLRTPPNSPPRPSSRPLRLRLRLCLRPSGLLCCPTASSVSFVLDWVENRGIMV